MLSRSRCIFRNLFQVCSQSFSSCTYAASTNAASRETPAGLARERKVRIRRAYRMIAKTFTLSYIWTHRSRLDLARERFLTQLHGKPNCSSLSLQHLIGKHVLVHAAPRQQRNPGNSAKDESYTLGSHRKRRKNERCNPLGVLRGLQTFCKWFEVNPDGLAAPPSSFKINTISVAWLMIACQPPLIPIEF